MTRIKNVIAIAAFTTALGALAGTANAPQSFANPTEPGSNGTSEVRYAAESSPSAHL